MRWIRYKFATYEKQTILPLKIIRLADTINAFKPDHTSKGKKHMNKLVFM